LILEQLDVRCATIPLDATPFREGDDIRLRSGGGESDGTGKEGQEYEAGSNHGASRESILASMLSQQGKLYTQKLLEVPRVHSFKLPVLKMAIWKGDSSWEKRHRVVNLLQVPATGE
jgi:hypothetical protein